MFVPVAVLLTATVTSVLPAGGTPSGTITFRDGSTTLAGCGGVSLNASGVATCNIPGNTLSSGSKSFTAEFVGGVNHLASTSPVLSYTYVACTASPVVANSNDSGAGSLRQAIADACPGSTITFNMGTVVSPIGLTSGTLSLARNVTIAGPGANLLTVQRTSGTFGVLTIQPGLTVTMSGVTIAGGTATGSPNRGGGIYNNGSNLTLSAVAVTRQHGHVRRGDLQQCRGRQCVVHGRQQHAERQQRVGGRRPRQSGSRRHRAPDDSQHHHQWEHRAWQRGRALQRRHVLADHHHERHDYQQPCR